MKRSVKIWAAVIGAVIIAAGGVWGALRPLRLETVTLRPETISLTFTETGSCEYGRLYSVYPLVSGEILELPVQEGDRVKAGDVIAVVSASDYEYQIMQLESAIAGYQGQIANLQLQEQQEKASLSASLQNLEGQLISLEAEMTKNQEGNTSLERQIQIQERIVDSNITHVYHARKYLKEMRDYGDDYEITQARQALNTAQGVLAQSEILLEQLKAGDVPKGIYEGQRQALQAQIDVLGGQMAQSYSGGMRQYYDAQIQAARSSMAQMEEKAGQAAVTAAVDGVISQLPAKDRNFLSGQTPAAVIGDSPCVEVFVPLREIDGIAVGDPVELILDKRLGSETLGGTVFDIEEEAQKKISALGVEERKVRVLIRPAEDSLQIGYDMDVRFSPHTFADVLAVPKTAVFQLDGKDCVWAIADGRLERRQVETGVETREGYIIDSGLLEGEAVVADSDQVDLREGKRAVAADWNKRAAR